AAGAEVLRDQAHQLRFREIRVVGGAHATAGEVGQGSVHPAEVSRPAVATLAPAPAVFVPVARDRATIGVAAIALAALSFLPWSAEGGASALLRGVTGEYPQWPLLAAALATLLFAWRELDRGTAVAAGFAVAWAFGAG